MREALGSIRFLVRTAFSLAPGSAVAAFVEVVGLVLQRLMPLWVALLVGQLAPAQDLDALIGAAGMAASVGLSSLFVVWGVNARLKMLDLVGHELDRQLARQLSSTPTLSAFNDPAVRDTQQIVKDRLGALGGSYNSFITALNGCLPPAISVAVAWAVDPRLLVLVLVALASLLLPIVTVRLESRAEEASAPWGQVSDAWVDACLGEHADELRMHAAMPWAVRQATTATSAWRAPLASAGARAGALNVAFDAVYVAVAAAVIACVMSSRAGTGEAVVALAAGLLVAADLRGGFGALRGSVESLAQGVRTVTRFRRAMQTLSPAGAAAPPAQGPPTIALDGVHLAYPDSVVPAVRDVTAELRPGAVVAVVGENGAGKSSLVNLLLGLYAPSQGAVRVNGQQLGEGNVAAWRERVSGVFQDHMRYELSVETNVGVGWLQPDESGSLRPRGGVQVREALQAAGADGFVAGLDEGVHAVLGERGNQLSGGQWQRIAIARGVLQADADLLVLDEPTSALDAYAESAVLDTYSQRFDRLSGRQGITVVVTHRLSTVRSADLVLMMKDGALVEAGTHRELMRLGGHYAELYSLYARDYSRDCSQDA